VSANTAVPLLEGVTTYRRPARLELVGAPPTEAFEQLTGYRDGMATNEKPQVEIPDEEPPHGEVRIDDITVGDGDEAVSGRVAEVHYVGVSKRTGEQFDASWDRGDTFKFGLGKGQVIAGWDEGVQGMKVGGRRRLTIPADKAYGKRGAGGVIGPDETLVFVVDLVGVR
jgi:peptidylprolyl isomerase